MGEVLKFPGDATKLGYRRARKRGRLADDPDQLDLFLPPPAPVAAFAPVMSPFEQALVSDERGAPQAAELYTRAIEQEDRVADAFCNLGILESNRGRRAKAVDCFTQSLRHDPRHTEAHYNLANLYFEENEFRLAQFHYEIAAEIDPTFTNALFNLALVQSLNDELPAAIRTLTLYQQRVTPDEARRADEFLRDLKQALANQRSGLGP